METKKYPFPILLILFAITLLSSCEFIGNVFKGGVYVGVILVIVVIVVVIWLLRRISR